MTMTMMKKREAGMKKSCRSNMAMIPMRARIRTESKMPCLILFMILSRKKNKEHLAMKKFVEQEELKHSTRIEDIIVSSHPPHYHQPQHLPMIFFFLVLCRLGVMTRVRCCECSWSQQQGGGVGCGRGSSWRGGGGR